MQLSDYTRPPVTEAVIELRTPVDLDIDRLAKMRARLNKAYPISQDLVEVSVIGPAAGPLTTQQAPNGHVLVSDDAADVVQITRHHLIVSRRAPYLGWAPFAERFDAALKAWRTAVGRPRLDRIGVRFINRIDIPWIDGDPVTEERDYLRVGTLTMPFQHEPFRQFATRGEALLPDHRYGFILQTGVGPPALIAHTSLVLDLDIFHEVDGVLRDDDIRNRLTDMRRWKNELFEASITDRTRELIR